MPNTHLIVQGAREHNLKNVSVRIPREALTVITGLSGSGKSSLAFDTIFAEGQRKYVESLSAYARQFLDQMQKPNVDHIEGLSPAISIEQRTAGSNPRSIVATTTEIYDYLRLWYSSIGVQHCPDCGKPLSCQSAEDIIEQLLALPPRSRVILLAPYVDGRKGEHLEVFQEIRNQGFVRARVDGKLLELEEVPKLNKKTKHSIEAVVDRLVIDEGVRGRLADSVELALRIGGGRMLALSGEGEPWTERMFSEQFACLPCGRSFEKLENRHFSFNSPYGACSACAGIGAMEVFDEELLVPNPGLSLEEGAVDAWKRGGRRVVLWYKKLLRGVAAAYEVSMDTPYAKLPAAFRKVLMQGSGEAAVSMTLTRGGRKLVYEKPFEGVIPNLERRLRETESDYTRQRLRHYMNRRRCPVCDGARLKPQSLACFVHGQHIHGVCRMSVRDALAYFENLTLSPTEQHIVSEVLREIHRRLRFLNDVGLDYLTLDRESGSLSGGEAQRIRLASQVGSGLMGVMYVLDEPSIGLHQRDNLKLIETMKGLRDSGNTVLVVEHDEQTIREADYVVDMGPLAGSHGGQVVFQGTPAALLGADTLTADYLNGRRAIAVPAERRKPVKSRRIRIRGAEENNLCNLTVEIPMGVFTCVTGVSGSGKSTLVDTILKRVLFQKFHDAKELPGKHKAVEGLELVDKAIVIDQSPIGRTPRSNPATYTGAFNLIRDLFARLPASQVRGYGPGRFSFNVKGGRCESCKGDGLRRIEMHFLPDVYVTCEQCGGRRYNRETLEVRYKGLNINEVLNLTVEEALEFFGSVPSLRRKLQTLADVGLGYLQVGQPATTLSGGEAQRVKLSSELSKRDTGNTLYILDEPTTGLHFADVHKLLEVLLRLRDAGNTLLVIEHNLDVIKTADWILDLGPEGGSGGGRLVAAGTPEEVAQVAESHTGRFLKDML